jgi:hypothetical protein
MFILVQACKKKYIYILYPYIMRKANDLIYGEKHEGQNDS